MTEIRMNYYSIYNNLIERAKNRSLTTYTENHHIIPRCMGGTDIKDNLVALTAEEHYIAHLLLLKMYPDNIKLLYAANMMANRNNKNYGWVRRKHAERVKIDNIGYKHTDAAKQKMSKARTGILKSKEWKNNLGFAKMLEIEYNGKMYKGYKELKEETGITRHLYLKFYKNGIDPIPYIGNNSYAMIEKVKNNHSKHSLGKKWYNNGTEEKYMESQPEGWYKGRMKHNRDEKGRYVK
jgi:NUMOD3 motif